MTEPRIAFKKDSRRDSKRVLAGIINILTEHLGKKGAIGEWVIDLYKKTGGGGQERVTFKRKINLTGIQALMYQVRPLDRDSSWSIVVYPPTGFDIDELVAMEKSSPQEEHAPKNEQESESVCDNQVYVGRISRHQKYGFEVEIEEKGHVVVGLVSLADLNYDPKALNKYPVGKNVKVLVCDSSKNPVTCSTRVDAVLSTSNSKDVFTGALNKDGSLPLRSFTKDYRRVFDLIQEFIAEMMESKVDFIGREKTIECATAYFKRKYNASTVDRRAVHAILLGLCHRMEGIPMAFLMRKGDGYNLTEFAWNELGGKEHFLSGLTPAIQDHHDQAICPEPELKDQEAEPYAVEAEPVIPEPNAEECEPVDSAPIDDCLDKATASIENAAMYFGKLCRLTELSSQIGALQAERDEIQKWLSDNKEMKEAAMELQSISFSKGRLKKLSDALTTEA